MGAEELRPPRKRYVPETKNEKKIHEPHSVLEELFEALESTVALLKIRSQPCTFSSVAAAVESVTKRRFLHSHLAKIKHLFPEAIECDSFTWKDRDTSTMKTDIRIKLLPFGSAEAKGAKSVSGMSRKFSADTVARRREFHKRVLAFEAAHGQVDIPEAPLTQEAAEVAEVAKAVKLEVEVEVEADLKPIPDCVTGKVTIKTGYQDIVSRRLSSEDEISMSHFPASFRRHFSKPRNVTAVESPAKTPLPTPVAIRTTTRTPVASVAPMTPLTPAAAAAKASSEPETPQMVTPKLEVRTEPASRHRHVSFLPGSVDALSKHEPVSPPRQSVVKSLRFDSASIGISDELLQSIHEKEQRALEEQNSRPAKRRQQMLAGLSQFFNMTRLLFQSQDRQVMLHKELVEHIESSSAETTDKDEIEERLRLLLELAPEWISSAPSRSGETLYRVQNAAEFSVIRKRIMEATKSC